MSREDRSPIPLDEADETQQAMRVCSNPNCAAAGQAQPLDAEHFARDKRYSGGFRTECRRCQSERTKAYNREHRDKATEARKRWAQKHREHVNAYQRDRYRRMSTAYQQQKQMHEQTA